ncbi:hypothetical protein DUNSADRAFT_10477 [Dunaliella salina]|uniref:Nudix hydrolase domain-containing protein n=1 Tax=Dunaliella salina TaxID=3046 RepID=A0ABQ7GFA3_DUNSA|nr:hypothetical protein DUNSADRAFT_10477 [Dunaliella salina]|eukprot:KAF5833277.1 hypothetical protein DUNSADRAFT_10477 [Dunaliella salina]
MACMSTDEEYGRALDTFVKGCADVILRDGATKEVLILKRIVHPQPDWWFMGGRMRAGETPQQAAAKNVKRETGMDIAPDRFRAVCAASYLWSMRKQAPSDNGTADIVVVQSAEITGPERDIASKDWDTEEYEGAMWVQPQALVDDAQYHPALRRAVLHLCMRDKWDGLRAAVDAAKDDATIAGLARELVQMEKQSEALEGGSW